jgi:uncharacterized RDD family membrane protein YckC
MIDFFVLAIPAAILVKTVGGYLTLPVQAVALGWGFYNAWLGGHTGQSTGKRLLRTRLVNEADGTVIGGAQGLLRCVAHLADWLPVYVGFLNPLWSPKRQAFSDMLTHTVVINDG